MTVIGGLDLDALSPVQREVAADLLALGVPRPPVDPGLAARVATLVEQRLADVVEARPEGSRWLTLGKTQLDALSCDGRYLDMVATPFEWNAPTVRGQLVHRAVTLDHLTDRATAASQLLEHAWEEFRHSGDSALAWCEQAEELEVAAVKGEALTVVEEFRAVFPALPRTWNVVWEPTIVARFGAGQVAVRGKPDLRLGAPHPTERRIMLVDLKTGSPSRTDVQDMRWYALLATMKYRQAPFRVATLYLDEAAWDHRDITEDDLGAAARDLATRLRAAIRLADDPVAVQLAAGPYCRWCGLAPDCEEKARADEEYAASARPL